MNELYNRIMKKEKKLQSIKNIFDYYEHPSFFCIYLSQKWEKIVPSSIFNICKPVAFQQGLLTLKTISSCHTQDLQFQKEDLIIQINKNLKNSYIKNIRFTVS